MSDSKVYILQKDLPDAKRGQKYKIWNNDSHYSPTSEYGLECGKAHFVKQCVENNSEWFRLEEEIEISKAKELLERKGYLVVHPTTAKAFVGQEYTEDDMLKCFNYAMVYGIREARKTEKGELGRVCSTEFINYLKSLK